MSNLPASALLITLGAILLAVVLKWVFSRALPAPLPPGPRGLPLLGNINDLPESQPWVPLARLGEQYGGIVYLNVLGIDIIVLNSAKHAINMLDAKSGVYSDRPVLTVGGTLVGYDQDPGLVPYSNSWRAYRRHFNTFMGSAARVSVYNDLFYRETDKFVERVRTHPKGWVKHARSFAAGIVLQMTYGMDPEGEHTLMKLVNLGMDQFSELTAANAFMVDVFPSLRFVPSWFPGASWKKKVPFYRETLQSLVDVPYNAVKERMTTGTVAPCFVSTRLESNLNMSDQEQSDLKWAAEGIYAGGADTTVACIECFFLAMLLHPLAQARAQSEIEAVVGVGRCPTLSDRKSLPYTEALLLEVMRVYTSNAGALGLPHASLEDDIHDGFFIPKGSMILTNTWQFCRDPETYSNPELFQPERFLATPGHEPEQDPRDYVFGYGRRVCPGIHIADATVWLACVSTIASLDIRCPVLDGEQVRPSGRFLDGAISHPEAFEMDVTIRRGH